MDVDMHCRTCMIEIKKEPVLLTPQLYKFLEDDLRFNKVPRTHTLFKVPQNVCFDCYRSLVAFMRFFGKCKEAELLLTKKFKLLTNPAENAGESIEEDDEHSQTEVYVDPFYELPIDGTEITVDYEVLDDQPKTDCAEYTELTENYEDQLAEKCFSYADSDEEEYVPNEVSEDEDFIIAEAVSGDDETSTKVEANAMRLYVCKTCDEEFNRPADLRAHETTHPGVRPFACEVCGQAFKQRAALNTHLALHYGKKIACTMCDKRFARRGFLIQHMRAHRGEKPFQCDKCGETFRLRNALVHHEKVHEGIRNCVCKFCGKAFFNRKHLISHINAVHRRYTCNICNKAYRKSSA